MILMIELIENRYQPNVVSPPGETLLDILEERGMSQAELSRRMGRPKKTINEIIQGKAAITHDTSLQLEKVLSVPSHFWINRQQHFDQYIARIEEREQFALHVNWLKRFPIREMIDFGWIEQFEDEIQQLLELLQFFGVASPEQWETVNMKVKAAFRQSKVYESEVEHVSAWLRRGEILGIMQRHQPYDANAFTDLLSSEIRSLTLKDPEEFVPSLQSLCSRVGVVVTFVPQLAKARVSGATKWLSSDKALIQLSLRYKTDDQLWFTFFHEAAHILLHGKREIFIDNIPEERPEETDEEEEANRFAADTLIPPDELDRFLLTVPKARFPSHQQIEEFANYIGIAPGIVVGRLQHDRLPKNRPIPFSHYYKLKKKLDWAD
jgi:HTH-type transcriptional regulator/antitoxin HigA